MDRVTAVLEVGINEQNEVVINHPDLQPDENGVGHIVFSANQARNLAALLLAKAQDCDPEPHPYNDPFLTPLAKLADMAGFALLRIDPGAEFGEHCKAARITGPMFPAQGLPFCIPAENGQTWAHRMRAALAAAFMGGMGKANDLNSNSSDAAYWAHQLARIIVSEVRSPGPDDEKVVLTGLMIRGQYRPSLRATGGLNPKRSADPASADGQAASGAKQEKES